jgi:hypothetical protein
MMRNIPGDRLSPFLFCTAVIALTHELNRADCGYQLNETEKKISHLLYMNDLKLLVRDEDELENEIKIAKATGKYIILNFVLKILHTFDNSVAYSTTVYQLSILF